MSQKKGNFPRETHVRTQVDERFVSVQKSSNSLEGLRASYDEGTTWSGRSEVRAKREVWFSRKLQLEPFNKRGELKKREC